MEKLTPRAGVRSAWGAMAHLYDTVISLLTQTSDTRSDAEIEQILPWFRKKSDLFKNLHPEILKDIIKNCEFMTCRKDSVVIRQGEKGDCFFIILTGSVSIHINTTLSDEELSLVRRKQLDEEAAVEKDGPEIRPLDRSKYGNFLGKIEAGKSFGELALINKDCVRNASIISLEVTDLLIVHKDLYNRSLRFHQAQAFEEKQRFVNSLPLFHSWHSRYKNMMAMSLRKEVLKFEDVVVKQGAPVDGLIFITSGQVKVVMEPAQHKLQYPNHFPRGNIADLEKEKARDLLRKEMNLEKKKGDERKVSSYQKRNAYTQEQKKTSNKHLELCLMGAVDIIGDWEMVLGLQTYAETIICTEEATVFILDQSNYDRLLEKRNPQSLNTMKDIVHNKLSLHFSRLSELTLPLFRYFLYTLDEKEKKEKLKRAPVPVPQEKGAEIEVRSDGIQKGPLINMYGPGSVFYLIRMRENKRKHRKLQTEKYQNKLSKIHEGHLTGRGPVVIQEEEIPNEGVSPEHESQLAISLAKNSMTKDLTDSFLSGVGEMYSRAEEEADWACSDSALTLLERRIQDWHSGFNDTSKGSDKRLVKLHRYQAEEHKPRPGNKVVIRLKDKSHMTFHSFRKNEYDAQTEPTNIKHSPLDPITYNNYSDDEQTLEHPDTERYSATKLLRPKTCPGFRIKSGVSKQYTREEYLALKEELKRRQRAYKSFLPIQRSTTVFL